jgi:phosphotransferase system enzyme I (PtsI)
VRLTRLLLGLGLRSFSMHPAHVLAVKQRVLTSDMPPIDAIVGRMRRTDDQIKLDALLEKLNA